MADRNPMMPGYDEIHILWTSEGTACRSPPRGCRAARTWSSERSPAPQVHLHNKVFAYETGDEFLAPFWATSRGELEPFILAVEGSIPNEQINGGGYWTSMGNHTAQGGPDVTMDAVPQTTRLKPYALLSDEIAVLSAVR